MAKDFYSNKKLRFMKKTFSQERMYIREMYLNGFRSKDRYNYHSPRSAEYAFDYIDVWLSDYLDKDQSSGKIIRSILIDSRDEPENPLYVAFKTKSFQDTDIRPFFLIMDILADGEPVALRGNDKNNIIYRIPDYLFSISEEEEDRLTLSVNTVENKLNELTALGLVEKVKIDGRIHFRKKESIIDTDKLSDAISFFSETDPLGIMGSYLLDVMEDEYKYQGIGPGKPEGLFAYKDHFLVNALDSEIMYMLFTAMKEHRWVSMTPDMKLTDAALNAQVIIYPSSKRFLPIEMFRSVQQGTIHILVYEEDVPDNRHFKFYLIDKIADIDLGEIEPAYDEYRLKADEARKHIWGTSSKTKEETSTGDTEHIEFDIRINENEGYVLRRLNREKRIGKIDKTDDSTYRFSADVYDCIALIPWVRTFIGRIVRIECTDPEFMKRWQNTLFKYKEMYFSEESDKDK